MSSGAACSGHDPSALFPSPRPRFPGSGRSRFALLRGRTKCPAPRRRRPRPPGHVAPKRTYRDLPCCSSPGGFPPATLPSAWPFPVVARAAGRCDRRHIQQTPAQCAGVCWRRIPCWAGKRQPRFTACLRDNRVAETNCFTVSNRDPTEAAARATSVRTAVWEGFTARSKASARLPATRSLPPDDQPQRLRERRAPLLAPLVPVDGTHAAVAGALDRGGWSGAPC
jgi:hypothetical protein